jgi:diaminopropionate ammonia-lyase
MFLRNQHPDYREPLDPVDAEVLGVKASEEVERYLTYRDDHSTTPVHTLPALAS